MIVLPSHPARHAANFLLECIFPGDGMKARLIAAASAALVLGSGAQAQDTTVLETLVVEGGDAQQSGGPKGDTIAQESSSATKTGTPIIETPRSVNVITEQRIADQGMQSVQDALMYTPGVFGATFGYDTRGDWAYVRGVSPVQYRDGLQEIFGFYNNVRPHPYALERVDIVKGPASTLYGQSSIGGIVNLTSKMPKAETSREAFVEYGTQNRKQVGVDMTGALDANGEFLYRFVGAFRDSDTQVDYVDDNSYLFAPSFTWAPSDDTSLTVLLNAQRNESGTSTQFLPWQGTIFPAPNGQIDDSVFLSEPGFDRYDTEQTAVTAIFDHRFNEVWSMSARARYSDSNADYRSMYPAFPPTINPDGRTIDRVVYVADSDVQAFTGDVRFNANTFTGALEHKIAFGVDQQYVNLGTASYYGAASPIDLYEPVYGNIPVIPGLSPRTVTNTRQTGFYVSDQVRLDNWFVSGGLRYDIARDGAGDTDNVLSKDVGLLYAFDNGISPYVSYSESFLPTAGTDVSGTPFRPLRGKQVEAGIKYQPVGTPSIFTASVFHIEENGRLVGDPTNPGFQAQLGDVTIRGFELEAQTLINSEFELLAGYSYLDTETSAGSRLASVPTHQASAWGTWRPGGEWEGFKAGAGVRYVGTSYDGVDTIETPDYVLADAMIGFEAENWDVTLNARNLFDKKHVTTCLARGDCFYGERRTVALKLTSKF